MKTKKTKTKCKRLLAVFLVIALCCFPAPVQAQDVAIPSTSENIFISDSPIGYSPSELPENIQHLLPETTSTSRVYLTSEDTQIQTQATLGNNEDDLYTLRVEDPVTGEGSITTFATPVKYIDPAGEMQFIDTSMTSVAQLNNMYSYQNTANAFTVKYGNTPHVGLAMDDAFTLSIDTSESATKAVTEKAENGAGKILYPNAFGKGTLVEYINTEGGVKENIILVKNIGKNEFPFTFKSQTHILQLTEDKSCILVFNKANTSEPEYIFQSLHIYDSFKELGLHKTTEATDFRHMSEDCHYELADKGNGEYQITVVVPEEFLNSPEVVYPVTIDPTIVTTASNSNAQDSFVDGSYPNSNYGSLNYLRFGRYNDQFIRAYFKFNSLPALPTGAEITNATLKFTFRSGQTTGAAEGMCQGILFDSWSESTITFNNAPEGNGAFYASSNDLTYFEFPVLTVINAWYAGNYDYHGFRFQYKPGPSYNDYNSVVSSEGEAARAPVLTLYYSITPNPIKVTISQTATTLNVGETLSLTASVTPSSAPQSITWSSSNTNVATVSSGYVTSVSTGTAIIYAKSAQDSTIYETCLVTVTPLLIYRTRNRETLGFANPSNDNDITPITAEDLQWGQKSTDTLTSNGSYISLSDLNNMTLQERITIVKNFFHSQISYDATFTTILDDMVDHFVEGTGTDYYNSALTNAVKSHQHTTNYVDGVKELLDNLLEHYSGNIGRLIYDEALWTQPQARRNHPMVAAMISDGLMEPTYSYNNGVPGLSLALNSLYGNKIEITKYVRSGSTYSGILQVTFYDHFGLDTPDLASLKYHDTLAAGYMPGFRQWYIMQHWNELNVTTHPKPYVTKITFAVPFAGSI